MSTITSKQPLILKRFIMFYIILCVLFISANSYSQNKWNRDQVKVKYDRSDNSINITCVFIDYEFGRLGELGYLEWGDFSYTHDGKEYTRLLRCVVKDQERKMASWVLFKDKLVGAKINVAGCNYPGSFIALKDYTEIDVQFSNFSTKSCFAIKWLIPEKFRVTAILFDGIWNVKGLHCGEYISGEVYEVKRYSGLQTKINTDSEQRYIHSQDVNVQKNEVKLFTQADAVVIKGTECGENIKVYNASGVEIKSIVTANDVVNIKLPKNQVYIISVGQSRYKAVL